MFVRWKRRKSTKRIEWKISHTHYVDAVLVENYREDGRVKQRFIKHLASIPDDPGFSWLIWNEASKRLDEMVLDVEARQKIEQMIERRFPRPYDEDHKKKLIQIENVVTKKGTNGTQI